MKGHQLVRCSNCEALMLRDCPSNDELRALYDYLFREGEYEQHRVEFELLKRGKQPRNLFRRMLLRRAEALTSGRQMIEIGGGTGSFGLLARSRGWAYRNFDISEVAVNCCKELGLPAQLFAPESAPPLPASSADLIVMWEVVEHVFDLRSYLVQIRAALRPNGCFLFSTPNYSAQMLKRADSWGPLSSPPIHVNFFDSRSIEAVLRSAGFGELDLKMKRVTLPGPSLTGLTRSIQLMLHLEEPETIAGFARTSGSL